LNIQQLRAVHEVVRQGMKISSAADALCKAQPGISRQLKEIEEELGVEIFRRSRNRISGLTPAGREILQVAERILLDIDNLHQIGAEYASPAGGSLTIATTHTHARYSLPPVVERFAKAYPKVQLTLRQGTPAQACVLVADGEADIAICTEPPRVAANLASLPLYYIEWDVVAPAGHPILRNRPVTLDKLANYPIITHDAAFSGQRVVIDAFSRVARAPRIALAGVHADVSKAYVARGLGLAVLAKVAFEPQTDKALRLLKVEHLFQPRKNRALICECFRVALRPAYFRRERDRRDHGPQSGSARADAAPARPSGASMRCFQ
jgi:LysR family cys regulon transcriptional activator